MATNYRKIWSEHYGNIPFDEEGRTYEIHHIDGNRQNNDVSNLQCITIEEHFKIHKTQNDLMACHAISLRMNKLPNDIKNLAKMAANKRDQKRGYCVLNLPHIRLKNIESLKKRIENGTFHLLGGEIQRKTNLKLLAEGRHNFQNPVFRKNVNEINKQRIIDGTHPFSNGVGAKNSRERVKNGTHHFLSNKLKEKVLEVNKKLFAEGKHITQQKILCEYCNKIGAGAGFLANHFGHCLDNPNNDRISCEYCNKLVTNGVYNRYHGKNCKVYKNVQRLSKTHHNDGSE